MATTCTTYYVQRYMDGGYAIYSRYYPTGLAVLRIQWWCSTTYYGTGYYGWWYTA
jgi:hypothetical protein